MSPDEPRKLAECLVKVAYERVAFAQKIAVAWFVALILLWFANIEVLVPQLKGLSDASKRQEQSVARLKEYRNKEEIDPGRLNSLSNALNEASASVGSVLKKARVPFTLPGFPSFAVKTTNGSLVWCSLFLGLILFLYHSRRRCFLWLEQASHHLLTPLSRPLRVPNAVVGLPWWLEPLPRPTNRARKPLMLLRLCVEPGTSRKRIHWAAIFLSAALLLQMRVAFVGLFAIAELESQSTAPMYLKAAILAGLVIATAFVVVTWFVPHRLSFRLGPARQPRGGRRQFLATSVTGVLGAAILLPFAVRPTLTPALFREPRFKPKRSRKPPLVLASAGFYHNVKSGRVHFVNRHGEVAGATGSRRSVPKEKNLRLVDGIDFLSARNLNRRLTSRAPLATIEDAVVHHRKAGQKEESKQLLTAFLRQNLQEIEREETRPYLRLCHLLAKLCILDNDAPALQSLIQIAGNIPNSEFRNGIAVWRNSDSRWYKRAKHLKL